MWWTCAASSTRLGSLDVQPIAAEPSGCRCKTKARTTTTHGGRTCPRYLTVARRLLRSDLLVGIVEQINLVGVANAQTLLIVDDADVLSGFDFAHLVRRLAVGGEDLIEFRQEHEAQDFLRLGILYFDIRRRGVHGNSVKGRGGRGERARRHAEEGCGDRQCRGA